MRIFYLDHPEHGTHICYSESDISTLEKSGWLLRTDGLDEKTEIDLLRERADNLGIEYHHRAGVEKLKELIAEYEQNDNNS